MTYVTRIAPSPTGMFHMGTARTAYFNWLAARASGGKFLLRIDDTDTARNDEAYVDVIHDALNWLGLDSAAVFRQSERMEFYREHVDLLLGKGLAYEDKSAAGTAVRLRFPASMPATWADRIVGDVKVSDDHRKTIDGMVIWRSDGTPTYHFASVVDDWSMGVNFVIRGNDHLNNTPRQIAILKAFGEALQTDVPVPEYAHLGLIQVMKDGKRVKLSKRDEAASLLGFRDAGYEPEAMLNYLLFLGWASSAADFNRTHPTLDKATAAGLFLTEGSMKASPVLFDQGRLDSLNKLWRRSKDA